jgi:hypothetical protein
MKNIVGDILQRPALAGGNPADGHQSDSGWKRAQIIAQKLVNTLGVPATVKTFSNQRQALDGTNFVVVCFQIGGYEPSTVVDFEMPKKYNLRQTIADTLGVGGIMRGLRTVPHLWSICEDMLQVAPEAIMLQYVNPDGDQHLGDCGEVSDDQAGWALSLGAGHRDGAGERPRHSLLGNPLSVGWHQPHGLLSEVRAQARPTAAIATSIRTWCGPIAKAVLRSRAGTRAAPTRCATR